MVEIEQRVSQLLRDMRESGLEKLSKVSYKHAAKMTQNQSLLLTYKAKALLAVDGGTWNPGHQYIDPNFRGD